MLGGLGVVGRDGIGVTDRDTTPFSFASLVSVVREWEERTASS